MMRGRGGEGLDREVLCFMTTTKRIRRNGTEMKVGEVFLQDSSDLFYLKICYLKNR